MTSFAAVKRPTFAGLTSSDLRACAPNTETTVKSAASPRQVDNSRPKSTQRLALSNVPVHFFDPQRHSHNFFSRAVCGISSVMP